MGDKVQLCVLTLSVYLFSLFVSLYDYVNGLMTGLFAWTSLD